MPVARRDLKKADDEIADSTYRKRISGLAAWVNRQATGKPNGHSERSGVNPTGLREEGKSYLRRSLLWSVHTGLPRQQCSGTGAGALWAVVSKGRSSPTGQRAESFGPRSRGRDFDGRTAAENKVPRRRRSGRNSFHGVWPAANVHGIRSCSILDGRFDGSGTLVLNHDSFPN